jgi:hydrogenase nickel incorporation protein HypA/HybF
MYELLVTETILEISLHHAQSSHAQRVTDLHLVIGQLSSLIDDTVQFYWDIISKGTICEEARLHFERRSAVLLCLDCG